MGKQRQQGRDGHQAIPVNALHRHPPAHAHRGIQLIPQHLQHRHDTLLAIHQQTPEDGSADVHVLHGDTDALPAGGA